MLYQLPTGKTIELSFAQWYALTEDDIEYLIAIGFGDEIEYPWRRSVLEKPETPEDKTIEITEVHIVDKLNDSELTFEE
jgi:hypothetical protein